MIDQAVILCGGLGTRLGALTADTPKPLLPLGDAPFLDTLLFELGRHGFRRILLLAGFRAELVAEYAAATPLKARYGLDIAAAAWGILAFGDGSVRSIGYSATLIIPQLATIQGGDLVDLSQY